MPQRKGYDPNRDIPDLSDKIILITGGTAGLGRESLVTISKHNPHIFFTGRDTERAERLISEVGSERATFIECDHASLSSVRDAAEKFLSLSKRLDVLICNAGVMTIPPGLSKDGYEIHFAINHLSHALLIKLLHPLLEETSRIHSEARIVTIGSLAAGHTAPGGIAFDGLRTTLDDMGATTKWRRYGHSKLANILYASEIARRYPSLTVVSLEPGTVWTGLFSHLGLVDKIFAAIFIWWRCIPIYKGAFNTCWAATANTSEMISGKFYCTSSKVCDPLLAPPSLTHLHEKTRTIYLIIT